MSLDNKLVRKFFLKHIGKTFIIFAPLILGACGSDDSESSVATGNWNVIVVLTDDQRWDTLQSMPITLDAIAARGITFTSAYATTPVCAPFRASFLSGGFYAHATSVLANNRSPNGGWKNFTESGNWAVQMRSAGYKTGYVGKYMNGMRSMHDFFEPIIPPGWNYFFATDSFLDWYNVFYVEGSSDGIEHVFRRSISGQYIVDLGFEKALDFLDNYHNENFLLVVSIHAPHEPATPAPQDATLFQDFLYRGRAWGEIDTSDKSAMVIEEEQRSVVQSGERDHFPRDQLRSLQAVDRGVGLLIEKLENLGKLDETAIFFLSDNGVQWGEHNLLGKSKPFDESIRVPLVGLVPDGQTGVYDGMVAANLDVPATILDIAGLPITGDGISLLPLLTGDSIEHRSQMFLENYALGGQAYVWSAVISDVNGEKWKLAQYQNGESELYDLVNDPYEETNQIGNTNHGAKINELSSALVDFKTIALLDRQLQEAVVGTPYHHAFAYWGADEVPDFELVQGSLPQGIQLDASSGVLTGIPTISGLYEFHIRATSKDVSPYSGKNLSYTSVLNLSVRN